MNESKKWLYLYFLIFCLESIVFAVYAHTTEPVRFPMNAYLLALSSTVSLLFLLPFALILWLGYKQSKAYIKRAIGKSTPLWIIFISLPLLVSSANITRQEELVVYLSYVFLGLGIIRFFRLPFSYTLLAIVFPGISLLYFLILGEMGREREKMII